MFHDKTIVWSLNLFNGIKFYCTVYVKSSVSVSYAGSNFSNCPLMKLIGTGIGIIWRQYF